MITRALEGATGLFDRFASSAVLLREASRTSRRWQTYASRVAFTGALFGVLLLGIYTAVHSPVSDAADMGWMGRAIFITISSVLMLLALVLAPIITSSAIIEETEDRTLEMLVLSKLEPSQILVGKVLSRILILLTIVFGALPVMAMVVTLGGVAPQAVVAVTIHTLIAVVLGGSLGAFFGLFTKSPMLAMLASVAYSIPTFLMLPLGYVASTGHPNDSVHFSLFAGPAAQDWSSPIALFSYLPALALIITIGTRLFELRIGGADIRKAFSGETWSTKTWGWGVGIALGSSLLLPLPVIGAYSLRYGSHHWLASIGLVLCMALIWAWWVLVLTLATWVLLRVGVDVVDALDAVLGGRDKRKRKRKDVRVWSNPVAWREARPAAWSANGGALLATWLLGMLGMFQTGWWLIPGGSLLMGSMNTLAAFALAVWLAARSVEEERRNQSLEVLLTTTVSSPGILFGKALGVAGPTFPLLLLSLPFIALGLPHLHMFDLAINGSSNVSSGRWFLLGCAAWCWSVSLWLVLIAGALLVGLRMKQQRSGFAVAAGLFCAAVGVPGALGRLFGHVVWIAFPCQLIAPPLAGGAALWQYALSTAGWLALAVGLLVWTSVGLRRWISAGLAILLALGVCTTPAHAQQVQLQDGFAMVAQPLGDGVVRADHWAAVRIKLLNKGRKAVGTLTLVERSGTTSTTFRRPVELPGGARKDVILLYRPNSSNRERVISLSTQSGRGAQAVFKVRQASPDAVTLGVLGTDLMGIQGIREASAAGVPGPRPREYASDPRPVLVGLLEPGVLPAHAAGYSAFDQLVWPGADPSTLTAPQLRALEHYVADGGHLVLTVTENWKALEGSSLSPLLPILFDGTEDTVRFQPVLEALGGTVVSQAVAPMAVGALRSIPGRRTFVRAKTSEGRPAWVTGTYGLGTVSVFTFDPRRLPFRDGVPPATLWRSLLSLPDQSGTLAVGTGWHEFAGKRALDDPADHLKQALASHSPHSNSLLGGGAQFDLEYLEPVEAHEQGIRAWLAEIPGVAPLPMSWLLAFSGLYLFVIGPLDWIGLKLLRKQPWTWVTFPVTIVVFSTVALVGTAWTKGSQAVLSTLEIIDVLPGTRLWRGDAHVGLFVTGRTRVGLRTDVEDSVVQPLTTSGYTPDAVLAAGFGPGSFSYSADTWTMGYARLRWMDEAPGSIGLSIVEGSYQVKNEFSFPLEKVQVVFPGDPLRVANVGTLAPGAERRVVPDDYTALEETLLYDSITPERGYLSVNAGQLLLIATIDHRVTRVQASGVRPSHRDRTVLRVPLGVPTDPGNGGLGLVVPTPIESQEIPP